MIYQKGSNRFEPMDNKNNLMYIMSGDVKTVEFNEAFEFNILDEARAPIYIINKGNIKKWIEERAVYSIRPNSRALKSIQGLSKLAADYHEGGCGSHYR